MRRLVDQVIRVVRAGWLGLAGQGLTFTAMFAPLVLARFDQLSYLLVSSAGAVVLAYTVTLAFSSLFPRIADPGEMTTSLRTSLGVLLGSSAVLAALGFGAQMIRPSYTMPLLGWSAMTLFQGLYLMSMGIAVRHGNYKAIPVARLVYGAFLATLTVFFCVVGGPVWSLVAVTCFSYLLGASYIVWVMRATVRDVASGSTIPAGLNRPSWLQYLRSSAAAGFSQALNGTASQLSVLILPGLGVYHDAWTAILRLVGGFGTVSQQLVAPALDIEVSTSVREGDHHHVTGLLRKELLIGLLVASAAVLLAASYFLFTPALRHLDRGQVLTIVVAMVLYGFGVLTTSVMFNSLILVGGDRYRVLWAGAKSLCFLAILFWGGSHKLVSSVGVEVVFAVIYAAAVFLLNNAKARDSGPSSQTPE